MLPKKFRLPIQTMIGARSVTRRSPYFLVKIYTNKNPNFRVGVIISKKTLAHATKRNLFKRRVFNFFNKKDLVSFGRLDILISVLPPATKIPPERIHEELKSILSEFKK